MKPPNTVRAACDDASRGDERAHGGDHGRYLSRITFQMAALLIVFGFETALLPSMSVVNGITRLFFDHVPRELFGALQVVIGVGMLVPGAWLRRVRNILGALVMCGWGAIIGAPMVSGDATNVVVLTGFLYLAAIIIIDGWSSIYRHDWNTRHDGDTA